ncbi:MAG: type II CAAX endopeptidase family protein [Rhizobiaceae bacterium]
MAIWNTPHFTAWTDRAAEGRTGLWRFTFGIATVLVIWMLATLLAFTLGLAGLLVASRFGFASFDFADPASTFLRFTRTRTGLVMLLLSLGGMWIGVWAAVRLFQKRGLRSVLSAHGFVGGDFWRAFAAFAILPFLVQLASLAMDPDTVRNPVPFAEWLLLAVVIFATLAVQTSGEEVFFRGYLPQLLGHRFRSPLVWGLLPALGFAALHWRGSGDMGINLAMVGAILVFALVLTWFVVRTGSLAAAMGAHFANNLVALLFISHDSMFEKAAFFNGKDIQSAGLGTAEALVQFGVTAAMVAAGAALVLHPRSPLALSTVRAHNG